MHRIGIAIALCAGSAPALADRGVGGAAGINLGHGTTEGQGLLFGAEVSAFWYDIDVQLSSKGDVPKQSRAYWAGLYADAVRDHGMKATRLSVGPEVGMWMFGLDGGYVYELGDADRHGATVRAAVTVGYVALYVRLTHMFGPTDTLGEVGVLFKKPFNVRP